MSGNQNVTREFADDPALVAWLHGMDVEIIEDDEDEKPHARKLRYDNEIVLPEPSEVTVTRMCQTCNGAGYKADTASKHFPTCLECLGRGTTTETRPMSEAELEAWQKSERADAERTSDDIG